MNYLLSICKDFKVLGLSLLYHLPELARSGPKLRMSGSPRAKASDLGLRLTVEVTFCPFSVGVISGLLFIMKSSRNQRRRQQ